MEIDNQSQWPITFSLTYLNRIFVFLIQNGRITPYFCCYSSNILLLLAFITIECNLIKFIEIGNQLIFINNNFKLLQIVLNKFVHAVNYLRIRIEFCFLGKLTSWLIFNIFIDLLKLHDQIAIKIHLILHKLE